MMHWRLGGGSEERSQQLVCCRAGDVTGGLDWEEQRERCISAVNLLACLVGIKYWLSKAHYLKIIRN